MSPAPSTDSVRSFAVVARPSVGLPSRIAEQFARRDLLPERFLARVEAGALTVEVECAGLADDVAAHIRDVLETFVGVERAVLATRERAQAA